MAPKKRQSRMYAAIDAMRPLGFSSQTVRATVKSLLKEYGGDDNWPFIEADAYMILIDAMAEDKERDNEAEDSSVGENMHDVSREGVYIAAETIECGGTDAGTSKLALSHAHAETVNTVSPTPQIGYKNTEVSPVKMLEHTPIASEPPKLLTFPRVKNLKPHHENLIKRGGFVRMMKKKMIRRLRLRYRTEPRKLLKLKRKHIEP